MRIVVYRMEYAGPVTTPPEIVCVPFDKAYYPEYQRIYNDCFFEMRQALDVQPYLFYSGLSQMQDRAGSVFLLLENGHIIGSVACRGNEIDDLIVDPARQHQGYGRQLLLFAMHRIRQQNEDPITLHVAQWNRSAVQLYQGMGFSITATETKR